MPAGVAAFILGKRGTNRIPLVRRRSAHFLVALRPTFAIFPVIASTFSNVAPLSRRFPAHFAPRCPLWASLSPCHVQVTQREQHVELRIVLGQALVARLLVFEDVLDDV